MATAKANKGLQVKERVITEYVAVLNSVELQLSANEAQFLADLLSRVGGHPGNTRRCLVDNITDALERVGVCYRDSPFHKVHENDILSGANLGRIDPELYKKYAT